MLSQLLSRNTFGTVIVLVLIILIVYYKYTIWSRESLIKNSVWMSHAGDILFAFDADDTATLAIEDTVISGAKYSISYNGITLTQDDDVQKLSIVKSCDNPRMMSITADGGETVFDVYRDELATDKKRW